MALFACCSPPLRTGHHLYVKLVDPGNQETQVHGLVKGHTGSQ